MFFLTSWLACMQASQTVVHPSFNLYFFFHSSPHGSIAERLAKWQASRLASTLSPAISILACAFAVSLARGRGGLSLVTIYAVVVHPVLIAAYLIMANPVHDVSTL
jgi:hypothetical protein